MAEHVGDFAGVYEESPRLNEEPRAEIPCGTTTEAEGLEPPKACARRISSAIPPTQHRAPMGQNQAKTGLSH